jgi:hypothetical protein
MNKKYKKKINKIDFGLGIKNAKSNKHSFDNFLKINPSKKHSLKHSPKQKKVSSPFVNSVKTKRPYHSYESHLNMNWNQVKKRYPGISPTSDLDFDGLINMKDCKPLNPARDGKFTDFIQGVKKRFGSSEEGRKEPIYQKAIAKEKAQKRYEKIQRRKSAKELRREQQRKEGEVAHLGKIGEEQESYLEQRRIRKEKGLKRYEKIQRRKMQKEFKKEFNKTKRREFVRQYGRDVKEGVGMISKMGEKGITAVFKRIEKLRPEKPSSQQAAIRRAVKTMTGQTTKQKNKGKKGRTGQVGVVGRPSGEYKTRINPFTGQPVSLPAVQYYKLVKRYKEQVRAQASNLATQVDTSQVTALARRGIPPEQAKQIIDTRQLQGVVPEGYAVKSNGETSIVSQEEVSMEQTPTQQQISQPQVSINEKMARLRAIKEQRQISPFQQVQSSYPRQYPQQYPQQSPQQYSPQSQVPPGYKVRKDIMTGRTRLEPLRRPERWETPRRFREEAIA